MRKKRAAFVASERESKIASLCVRHRRASHSLKIHYGIRAPQLDAGRYEVDLPHLEELLVLFRDEPRVLCDGTSSGSSFLISSSISFDESLLRESHRSGLGKRAPLALSRFVERERERERERCAVLKPERETLLKSV